MAREPVSDRERAYRMYRRSRGKKKLSDIAAKIGVAPSTIRGWKRTDDWEGKMARESVAKPPGAPKGNQNALGNHGGAPIGSQNALTHGAYAQLMSERMTQDERAVWAEEGYSEDTLEALRLEVRSINVQQLRLMTRLGELRRRIEELRGLMPGGWATDAGMSISADGITLEGQADRHEAALKTALEAEIGNCVSETYTIEKALDRASGRKTRILQLLYEAGSESRETRVVFGGVDEPGQPVHEADK